MNKKTWIWICAAVVLILAVLLIFKPFGAKAAPEAAETAAEAQQTAEPSAQPVQTAQPAVEETPEETEEPQALLIEEDGEIEIIVPEDEGSAGF